jgi:G3E family GTPase
MTLISAEAAQIPVSILTGFLGSGKTTVLNGLTADPTMHKALIIINEFGAVGLDHDLVSAGTEDLVVEMMGGCLCCTIRGDLKRALLEAPLKLTSDGACAFDRVLIETTGLADPAPILHTLMTDLDLLTLYRLDGVVATVDASNALATLDSQEESVKQAAVADRLLLTKTDLVTPAEVAAIRNRLRAINPAAAIIPVLAGQVRAGDILEIGLYDPASKSSNVARWLNEEAYRSNAGGHDHATRDHAADDHSGHDHGGHHAHNHDHHHDHDGGHDINRHGDGITATCLILDDPLDPLVFDRWISTLTDFMGPDILRLKAIVNIAGCDKPMVLHGVQHVLHMPVILPRWPSADRRTRMVFILRNILAEELHGLLDEITRNARKNGWIGMDWPDPDAAERAALTREALH